MYIVCYYVQNLYLLRLRNVERVMRQLVRLSNRDRPFRLTCLVRSTLRLSPEE